MRKLDIEAMDKLCKNTGQPLVNILLMVQNALEDTIDTLKEPQSESFGSGLMKRTKMELKAVTECYEDCLTRLGEPGEFPSSEDNYE